MTANILIFAAVAAFFGLASAEFPLVWICIGLTVVGIAIAMYVAYRRPMEPYSPEVQNAEPFEEEEQALSHQSGRASPKDGTA